MEYVFTHHTTTLHHDSDKDSAQPPATCNVTTSKPSRKTKKNKKTLSKTQKPIKPIPGKEPEQIMLCSVNVCSNIVVFCFSACFFVFLFLFGFPLFFFFGFVDFDVMTHTRLNGRCKQTFEKTKKTKKTKKH